MIKVNGPKGSKSNYKNTNNLQHEHATGGFILWCAHLFLTVGEACRDVQTLGLFVTQIVQKNNQSLTAAPQSGGKSLTGHRKPANHSHFFAYIGSANTRIRTIVTGIRTDFAGIRTVTN
ncbi:MAG: hypothetical protein SOY63_01805 [Alloprevotella sp.]|nr:hypothetical protein [Alloprevotella sp.]